MQIIEFNPKLLEDFFNIKVREACKSCKRFGKKVTCPPYIDSIDYYKNLLPYYRYGVLIIEKFLIKDYTMSTWQELGAYSSKIIHNQLLEERNKLLERGIFSIIFGAGSCKFCSEICTFPCKHPEKSVVPIEATGLDVIGLVYELTKIELKFPVENQGFFYRIGMMLYD